MTTQFKKLFAFELVSLHNRHVVEKNSLTVLFIFYFYLDFDLEFIHCFVSDTLEIVLTLTSEMNSGDRVQCFTDWKINTAQLFFKFWR